MPLTPAPVWTPRTASQSPSSTSQAHRRRPSLPLHSLCWRGAPRSCTAHSARPRPLCQCTSSPDPSSAATSTKARPSGAVSQQKRRLHVGEIPPASQSCSNSSRGTQRPHPDLRPSPGTTMPHLENPLHAIAATATRRMRSAPQHLSVANKCVSSNRSSTRTHCGAAHPAHLALLQTHMHLLNRGRCCERTSAERPHLKGLGPHSRVARVAKPHTPCRHRPHTRQPQPSRRAG